MFKTNSDEHSRSTDCSGAVPSTLVEFIDDVTGEQVTVRPEHIDSMSRYKFKNLTMIKTKLGFFLAKSPDYGSLVTHWSELLKGRCSFTGKEVVRES